jgi:hypothetical protein
VTHKRLIILILISSFFILFHRWSLHIFKNIFLLISRRTLLNILRIALLVGIVYVFSAVWFTSLCLIYSSSREISVLLDTKLNTPSCFHWFVRFATFHDHFLFACIFLPLNHFTFMLIELILLLNLRRLLLLAL